MGKVEKNIFKFTLVLVNVTEPIQILEGILSDVFCDDALITIIGEKVYLEFSRKSASLCDAIILSIKQLESASFCINKIIPG